MKHAAVLATGLLALGLAAPAAAQLKPPAPPPVAAGEDTAERLLVTDPYLELRTGPGRGYPVFHVAMRDEWIEIRLRHTDWFQVRAAGGQLGWVHRPQLDRTLTEAGSVKTFRDVLLDDYLQRRVEFGGAWGRFKSEPMLKLWAGWRLSDSLALEGTVGQVQGLFSGTSLWHLDLVAEPWSDQRWSPFFGVGVGRFRNVPNASLVDAQTTNANLAHAGVGLRYHLSERFVLRADYSIYTAFVADTRAAEYRAFTAGLSFFF